MMELEGRLMPPRAFQEFLETQELQAALTGARFLEETQVWCRATGSQSAKSQIPGTVSASGAVVKPGKVSLSITSQTTTAAGIRHCTD